MTTHDRSGLAALAVGALAVSVAIAFVWSSPGAATVMFGATLAVAAVAAVVDVYSGRIPNSLVLMAGVLPLAYFAVAAIDGRGVVAAADLALGGLLFAGPLFVMHLVTPDSLGFGDVKLAVALGAALGAAEPRLGLLALCVAAGSAAALGAIRRRRTVPFGPGLVLGAGVAMLVGLRAGEGAMWWH